MKNYSIFAVILIACVFVSCGVKQASGHRATGGVSPFGTSAIEAPCQLYDTEDYFAATASFRGTHLQPQELQLNALNAAQEIIYRKMIHIYEAMVSDYHNSIGNNRGNDIERKLESAGDRIIKIIVKETSQKCIRYSEVLDNGDCICTVGIEISKEEVARRVSTEVSNKLTQEEKNQIRYNEQQYRDYMNQGFKTSQTNH